MKVFQIFSIYPQKYQPYNVRLIDGLRNKMQTKVVSLSNLSNVEKDKNIICPHSSKHLSFSAFKFALKNGKKSFKSRYTFYNRYHFIIKNPNSIFHFHNLQSINIEVLDYMITHKIKYSISLRGFDVTIFPLLSDNNKNRLIKILDSAWKIHSVCKSLVTDANQYSEIKDKTHVIYRTPNLKDAYDFIPKQKLKNEINIFTLSRVHWKKCISESLISIKKLLNMSVNVKYHIIGGFQGDERNRIIFLIKKLKLQDYVVLHGYKEENEYRSIIDNMDLCWIPTINEGLPNTLYFLLKSGIPTIASETDGIPEVIKHEYNGLLFKPYNFDELFNLTKNFIKNDSLRLKIAENAKKTELQTLENEISQYQEMYESK